MSRFELNIKDDVKSTEWVEIDPFNHDQLCQIILHVDWETEEAEIRTEYNTGSMDYRTYMHMASEWNLPYDTDAGEFKNFYNEKIRPIILKMSNFFDVYWDGSNHRGKFTSGQTDPDGYDTYNPLDDEFDIHNLLLDAPRYDAYVFFDVAESFQNYEDIIDELRYDNIEFMSVDLDDDNVIEKIRDSLESGEYVYIMDDEQFKNDLKNIKEMILEEQEEDD